MKTCILCNTEKPISEFNKDKQTKDGYRNKCRICLNEYRRSTYNRRAETEKFGQLRRKYKITPLEYDEMIKEGCEVCGSFERLCIDHDHSCCPGKWTCGECIRGILCRRCNIAEGLFKKDPQMMHNLAVYMEKHGII